MAEKKPRTWERGPAQRVKAPVALRVVETGAHVKLPASGETLSIGSGPTSALTLDDRYVSRDHCELLNSSGALVLRDRASRNGTYVNGARVREAALEVGTRVQIGGLTLEVVGEASAGAAGAGERLAGDDPAFRAAVEQARRGARSGATVLLIGESGTGKELFAHLIHDASSRADGPFVAVNCGAISRDLVESELFGHESGAFTGARDRRHGVFEQAHRGTLFLDEIAELPGDQQVRLLRVLETRRVKRVGGESETAVNVRVVAATHKDLRAEPGFRADLYHRLAAIEVKLPPLRERRSDIPQLARRFLAEIAQEHGGGGETPAVIDEALARRLCDHAWTGNVRELRNAMQRYAVMGAAALEDFLAAPPIGVVAAGATVSQAPAVMAAAGIAAEATVDEAMRDIIAGALARHGSVRKGAAAVGLAKSTFFDMARRLGLLRRGGKF
jgi:DNA-binding NtrC family response regulator